MHRTTYRTVLVEGRSIFYREATSELVAQGLSNQQVAERMYLSAHTIAAHLRQIFSKLSIGSRVELTRIVLEHAQQPEAG